MTNCLLNVHRAIVRSAMDAEGWEIVGEFERAQDEEYGKYVLFHEDDVIEDERAKFLVCSLDEDFGDIYYLSIEDALSHPEFGDEIKRIMDELHAAAK